MDTQTIMGGDDSVGKVKDLTGDNIAQCIFFCFRDNGGVRTNNSTNRRTGLKTFCCRTYQSWTTGCGYRHLLQ